MTTYDDAFFAYVNSGSLSSARHLLSPIAAALGVHNVLDVGCGQGAWLSVWQEQGVQDVVGIDGDYVDQRRLLIPADTFRPINLTNSFELGRKFDLVQSLEVAEHLPASVAAQFVATLCAHGDLIMFSAAPPGQGGDHHVNERSYDYWRELFDRQGYQVYDFVRPLVAGNSEVEPWYRFNVFLYASPERAQSLPESVRKTLVPRDAKLKDISPATYKARKALVRTLPVSLMTRIAKLKESVVTQRRLRRG